MPSRSGAALSCRLVLCLGFLVCHEDEVSAWGPCDPLSCLCTVTPDQGHVLGQGGHPKPSVLKLPAPDVALGPLLVSWPGLPSWVPGPGDPPCRCMEQVSWTLRPPCHAVPSCTLLPLVPASRVCWVWGALEEEPGPSGQ